MFKKAVEAKSHQRLSGSDRKKLRRTVQNRFFLLPDELFDAILPPNVEITVSKFQNRVLVYSIEGGCPMFFDIDGRGNEILPTVFALWEAPEMLPSFMLKGGEVSRESAEGHYVPNAGFWENVVMEDPAYLDSGSGEEISDASAGLLTSTGNEEDESALETASTSATDAKNDTEEHMVGSMNELNLADDVSANEANTEKQNTLSPEEVDALLDQCLLQALHTTLKEKDLPIPGSTLW